MIQAKQKSVSSTVQLQLYGPKAILTGTKIFKANMNQTWYELLNGEGGLKVSSTSGLSVCTLNYTYTAPKDGQGWSADLHEQIGDFVNKFERKRKQFSVRLFYTHNNLPRSSNSNNTCTNNTSSKLPKLPSRTNSRNDFPNNVTTSASSHGPSITIPLKLPTVMNTNQHPLIHSTKLKRKCDQTFEKTGKNGNAKGQGPTDKRVKTLMKRETQQKKYRRIFGGDIASSFIHPDNLHRAYQCDLQADAGINLEILPYVKEEGLAQLEWYSDNESDRLDVGGVSCEQYLMETQSPYSSFYPENIEGLSSSGNSNEEIDLDDFSDPDEDIDDQLTEVSNENDQLLREGIEVVEIKPLILERANYIDNDIYLKVKNEIRRLKKTKQWAHSISRAPLSSFLLQSLVGE